MSLYKKIVESDGRGMSREEFEKWDRKRAKKLHTQSLRDQNDEGKDKHMEPWVKAYREADREHAFHSGVLRDAEHSGFSSSQDKARVGSKAKSSWDKLVGSMHNLKGAASKIGEPVGKYLPRPRMDRFHKHPPKARLGASRAHHAVSLAHAHNGIDLRFAADDGQKGHAKFLRKSDAEQFHAALKHHYPRALLGKKPGKHEIEAERLIKAGARIKPGRKTVPMRAHEIHFDFSRIAT